MKYIDEYRDAALAHTLAEEIAKCVTQPWVLMEICGGQTHTLMRYGIDEMLPSQVELVHGPGCPVCVTPLEIIDKAIAIASRPDVTFCLLWRYAARARVASRSVSRQGGRRGRADRLFADGSGSGGAGASAAQGGFLRGWI